MLRLLAVVLVIGGAFVASLLLGSVLEHRAIAERAARVQNESAAGLAVAPLPVTPEKTP